MARIRGRDTKPELLIRRGLHARGFRYRLHARLRGRPDIVLPSRKAAIFVHGCFWHGHDCHLFRLPGTRTEFWREKIAGNRSRDTAAIAALQREGWRTLTIWECSFRGKERLDSEEVLDRAADFLCSELVEQEIRGVCDAGYGAVRLD
jgi:DNA mismatch endonuclease (patch repair protein)